MPVPADDEFVDALEEQPPEGQYEDFDPDFHDAPAGDDPEEAENHLPAPEQHLPVPQQAEHEEDEEDEEDEEEEEEEDDDDSDEEDLLAMQDHALPDDINEPLYEGSPMTIIQHYLSLHHHFQRFSPSREEKASILQVVQLACPLPNRCFQSINSYDTYLGNASAEYCNIHTYCERCGHIFQVNQVLCPDQHPRDDNKFFLTFNIEAELRTRCRDAAFWNAVQLPLHRVRLENGVVKDIYDGTIYPEGLQAGQLTSLGSADGITIFKSTKNNLWLVMLAILELPPHLRYKQDNMLMIGAWFGGSKPDFDSFLRPISAQLNELRVPKEMRDPEDQIILVSFRLLTMSADNPAKEAMLNLKASACGICEQVAELVADAAGHLTIHTFPLQEPPAIIRTKEAMLDQAEAVVAQVGAGAVIDDVGGVKGPTSLMLIQDLDPVLPIDYSHNVCLRVTAKMLGLWFDAAHGDQVFSVRGRLIEFDQLMTDVRPPSFITRPPRPYSTHAGHWKAVEFRAFLLYYGPIVLRGILNQELYLHFLLLSGAVGILLGRAISQDKLNLADGMLTAFLRRFPALYHQKFVSRTVHSLVHLVACVRKTGPLWVTSCFPFESSYHYMKKLIHGTRFVLLQVISLLFFLFFF